MRRQVLGWVLASLAVGVSGCQSWSQVGQGMPSGSRVPPPGTGTYQVPSSYYNGAGAKTGAVSTNAQPGTTNQTAATTTAGASPSGAPTTVGTSAYPIPTVDQVRGGINNTASAVFSDVNQRANQVVQAGTARAAAAAEKYTDSAPSLRPAGVQPASFSAPAQYSGQTQYSSQPSTAPASGARQPSSSPSNSGTSRSLSDSGGAEAEEDPQLNWQAPQ